MERGDAGEKFQAFARMLNAPAFAGARMYLQGAMKSGCVYLMANHRRGQTYLGVTSNLQQRAWQHRNGVLEGHSKDKGCVLLVWYEYFDDLQDARASEYRMKKWQRAWKLRLIEERNPDWNDLYETLF